MVRRPSILKAFSEEEYKRAHRLLAAQVIQMRGRKLEEDDWAAVYCAAKDIPKSGWSNLNIDVIHKGLGVEHKMYRPNLSKHDELSGICGRTLMHPSATRSIRIQDGDPNEVMRTALEQYANLIQERRRKVRETAPEREPDMRTGWLLWQTSLRDFIYFEEEMLEPDPDDYYAEWKPSSRKGARKPSKSLWIFERENNKKRYSVTTSAGAKIQPYFDVPSLGHPHLYFFRVQGEEINKNNVRIWVETETADELRSALGTLDGHAIEQALDYILSDGSSISDHANALGNTGPYEVIVTSEAYSKLRTLFRGTNDDQLIRALIRRIQSQSS